MFSAISSSDRMLGSGVFRSPGMSTPESAAASGRTNNKISSALIFFDGCALPGLHSLRSSPDGCALPGLHSLRSLKQSFDWHAHDAVIGSDEKPVRRSRERCDVQGRKPVG